jgi:ribosomal protein L29
MEPLLEAKEAKINIARFLTILVQKNVYWNH